MNSVEAAINDILEKNLNSMRENLSLALSQKAAETLEERKEQLASSYFEQR